MGINGDITMTNLQFATGIGSYKLSAHHPNSTGNQTKFGDFLVNGIGRTGSNSSRLLIPYKVNGSTSSFSGSYNGSTPSSSEYEFNSTILSPPDTFIIQIAVPGSGEHFREQIAKRSQNLSFTDVDNKVIVKDRDFTTTRNGFDYIDYQFEMTGYGFVMELKWLFADGMNTDATNYNDPLYFRTRDIEEATPRVALEGQSVGFADSYDGSTHDYDINSGPVARSAAQVLFDPNDQIDEANATWELYLNGSLEATTNGDPSFPSPSSFFESGDTWELHLIDSNNNFVDAVRWEWGTPSNPYADSGQTRTANFGDRQDENQASGPSNPVTLLT